MPLDARWVFESILKTRLPERGEAHVMCPFHLDSESPSMVINWHKGVFYCFGGCSEPKGGNYVTFYARHHKIPKEEAYKHMVRAYNLPTLNDQRIREGQAEFFAFIAVADQRYRRLYKQLSDSIEEEVILGEDFVEWEHLEALYKDLSDVEYCLTVLDRYNLSRGMGRVYLPDVVEVEKEVFQLYMAHRHLGLWNHDEYEQYKGHVKEHEAYINEKVQLEERWRIRIPKTPV